MKREPLWEGGELYILNRSGPGVDYKADDPDPARRRIQRHPSRHTPTLIHYLLSFENQSDMMLKIKEIKQSKLNYVSTRHDG